MFVVILFVFLFYFFFFFQAEDGIRDRDVTGVQTCALRSASSSVLLFLVLLEEADWLPWQSDSKTLDNDIKDEVARPKAEPA